MNILDVVQISVEDRYLPFNKSIISLNNKNIGRHFLNSLINNFMSRDTIYTLIVKKFLQSIICNIYDFSKVCLFKLSLFVILHSNAVLFITLNYL